MVEMAEAVETDAVKGTGNEYFETVHSSAGGDLVVDGGGSSRGRSRIQAIAGFCAAASRLSDDPGGDLLSGSKSRRDVFVGDGPARTTVRTGARFKADDVDKLVRVFGHHAAIFSRSQHRHRRAGSSGGHQRGRDVSSA